MVSNIDAFFHQDGDTPIEQKDIVVVDKQQLPVPNQVDTLIVDLVDVRGHEDSMNQLATTAMDVFDEVMEMARNAEEKNVAEILNAAAHMKRIALDSKNSILKARQKSAEILLKKKSMDDKKELEDADVIENEPQDDNGSIKGDRNSIMNLLKNGNNDDK